MDTAIAIRTAIVKDGWLNVQAGAGIVADSVPELEWMETLNKARSIMRAAAIAESGLQFVATPENPVKIKALQVRLHHQWAARANQS